MIQKFKAFVVFDLKNPLVLELTVLTFTENRLPHHNYDNHGYNVHSSTTSGRPALNSTFPPPPTNGSMPAGYPVQPSYPTQHKKVC